jgi:hypothetical protein
MLKFYAHSFVAAFNTIGQVSAELRAGRTIPTDESMRRLGADLGLLHRECEKLGLKFSTAQIRRLINKPLDRPETFAELLQRIDEIVQRIWDELNERTFIQIDQTTAEFYDPPISSEWSEIAERFKCSFDIEEARKCLALERSTAAVFHLMRITESAVLELQLFLDKPDPKAHFGSVLARLDTLNRKTEFKDLPDHLKQYRAFLIDIIPQMYAVKNSWRDKVAHVDGKVVPVDVFTHAMAIKIHDATLTLMQKLVDGLPKSGA